MVSQMKPDEGGAPSQPRVPEVMAAITSCQTALTNKIDAVQLDIGLGHQDLDKMRSQLILSKQRIGHVENIMMEPTTSLWCLQIKLRALEYRAEDAEKRSQNNHRIVGLKEGMEGKNPTAFVEELLRSLLPAAQFSPFYTVDRTHRVPLRPGPEGSPPSHPDTVDAEHPRPR